MNQEQMTIITKVIDRTAPKYVFGFYELEDIKQESYIICLNALENYDNNRPLENFLSKHLSNRLKDLKRNKYFRHNTANENHQKLHAVKKNLMDLKQFCQIAEYDHPFEDPLLEEKLTSGEALELVMDKIGPSLRNDFLRMANDVTIPQHKKQAVINKVKEILGEDW
jgi:DNA-directed RNA polymerase specialized sigma24 family protein